MPKLISYIDDNGFKTQENWYDHFYFGRKIPSDLKYNGQNASGFAAVGPFTGTGLTNFPYAGGGLLTRGTDVGQFTGRQIVLKKLGINISLYPPATPARTIVRFLGFCSRHNSSPLFPGSTSWYLSALQGYSDAEILFDKKIAYEPNLVQSIYNLSWLFDMEDLVCTFNSSGTLISGNFLVMNICDINVAASLPLYSISWEYLFVDNK